MITNVRALLKPLVYCLCQGSHNYFKGSSRMRKAGLAHKIFGAYTVNYCAVYISWL